MLHFFQTYRGRLIVYSIALMLFLSTTTVYSYYYISSILRTESDNHIERMTQLSHTRLQELRNSLQGYTEIVRSDLRLQEYMYVVSMIGSDKKPLQDLYQRHFGWLPTDQHMIIASSGKVLLGKTDKQFIQQLQPLLDKAQSATTYIPAEDGLDLVALSPIHYRDSLLGFFIVSKRLGQTWLELQHHDTGILAFFEKQGTIIASCSSQLLKASFEDNGSRLQTDKDTYYTYQLKLPGVNSNMPRLWYAIQDTEITARLDQHQRTIMLLVGIGVIAITVFGFLLIRNFSRPLSQLITLTREIAAGKLPTIEKTNAQDEVSALTNQFSDMVVALRENQQEIEQVHAALKKSAITDMLTGLYNRRYLQVVFPKLIAQAQRDQHHVAALLIDIDKFKKINDTHGHLGGDLCLAHFSDELKAHSRANDYLFRIGGEEFLILTIADDIEGIINYAEKLRHSIEHSPTSHNNEQIQFTVSCGISFANPENKHSDILTQLLGTADEALYKAKNSGRNQIQIDQASLDLFTRFKQPQHIS